MRTKNILYFIFALVITASAALVWVNYSQLDELGLTPAQREEFEQIFIEKNAEVYSAKFDFNMDLTALNNAPIGSQVDVDLKMKADVVTELLGAELYFEYDESAFKIDKITKSQFFDYYLSIEPELEPGIAFVSGAQPDETLVGREEVTIAQFTITKLSDKDAEVRLIGKDFGINDYYSQVVEGDLDNSESFPILSEIL